jgi:hypothetical protein
MSLSMLTAHLASAIVVVVGFWTDAAADPVQLPVVYNFAFQSSGVTDDNGTPVIPHPSFEFSFRLLDFVTETGLFELPAPIAIGSETITHAGTNIRGDWIFGNGIGDRIIDGGWELGFDTLGFAFSPSSAFDGYITRPLVTSGYFVQGATSFRIVPQLRILGTGTVQVAPVPEPSTLLLLTAGAVLGARRISKRARAC